MSIHFKNDLAQIVEKLHAANDTREEIKDLNRINNAIYNFYCIDGIHQARLLDQELREKYIEINLMLRIAEEMSNNNPLQKFESNSQNCSPVELECLKQDYYGISVKLLMDLHKIHEIKEFIDHVD